MDFSSPEITIILIVLGILFVAYTIIYPIFVGPNLVKWLALDVLFSIVTLAIVGFVFWNTGFSFKLPFISINWFWFALFAYGIIEMPLAVWYANKHKLWETEPSENHDD